MLRPICHVTLLVLLLTACNAPLAALVLPQPTATLRIPDDVPTPPTCGNGVCEAPYEHPFTCPTDCPKPATVPATVAAPAPTSAPTSAPATGSAPALKRPLNPQLGLNFIRFYWSARPNGIDTSTPYVQPASIFRDFKDLGVHAYRQFVKADLLWDVVEPRDGQWNFASADAVIPNADFEPVVTLFSMQYASPTPPWATSPQQFQKTMGTEATDYVTTVVKRYAPYVKYWELGNELSHWRAADPDSQKLATQKEERVPDARPANGFSPREQGVFLAQAAALIRRYDPEAVILMPGMASLGEYETGTWLPEVIQGGGKDWFDIVNYHYYSGWEQYTLLRPKFEEQLKNLGIDRKPVWMTESGSTSLASLTIRTNYPNSPESQAADVFRRIVQAWGNGDAFCAWHTYIGSQDSDGSWSAYGIRTDKGNTQLSYYAFRLLASELVPFDHVEKLSADARGVNAYRIVQPSGAAKYVLWGKGTYVVPSGVSQTASVIPGAGGAITWQPAQVGKSLTLSTHPLLLK